MSELNSCDSHLLEDDIEFDKNPFGFDPILLKSIKHEGFTKPTIVQNQCIPLILEGKDILVRARTGSGKTLAYALPIIQKLLLLNLEKSVIRVIILVPTNELVHQVFDVIQALLYQSETITCCALLGDDKNVEITKLRDKPTIVIATPKKLVDHMRSGIIHLKNEDINVLVIDEADLVLSYGYDKDVRYLIKGLPPNCQSILMSATLSEDVLHLKKLLLHNPVILKLQEDNRKSLIQMYMTIEEGDKFLLIFSLIKLNIVKGKVLFFVNSIEKAYRFKLFLEQFSIKCAVLNSELPFNSRLDILDQYNSGTFQYLIATDESLSDDIIVNNGDENEKTEEKQDESGEEDMKNDEDSNESGEDIGEEDKNNEEDSNDSGEGEDESESGEKEEEDEDESEPGEKEEEDEDDELEEDLESLPNLTTTNTTEPKQVEIDYGVSRGFDFKNVDMVINFDFPLSLQSYLHRIGRTARANLEGTALSLVNKTDENESNILKEIQQFQPQIEGISQPHLLVFDIKEINTFRYRVEDICHSITRNMIKEARRNEVKQEIINSEKLKAHFDENPVDLELLQHDRALLPKKVKKHLKIIPNYLLPPSLQKNYEGTNKTVARRRVYNAPEQTKDPLQTITLGLDNVPLNNSTRTEENPKFSILSARNRWRKRHHKPTSKKNKKAKTH